MTNFDAFIKVYIEELEAVVRKHPEEYRWPIENFQRIIEKMIEGFRTKTYSLEGRAIRATCKRLDIHQTYKDINAFLDKNPAVLYKAG